MTQDNRQQAQPFKAPKLAPLPGFPNGKLTTDSSRNLMKIKDECSSFDIENVHNTASGVAGYFTDRFDGRRYKVTVQAINVFEGEEEEHGK